MRRWPVFLLLTLLAVMVAPVSAIPADFTAWLYTPDTGTMTLVNLSGEVDSFPLPLTAPFDTRPYTNVAVSPDGNTIAYVIQQYGTSNQQLMVYHYPTGAVIAQYPMSDVAYTSIDFGSPYAFSPDSTQVAFGYSRNAGGWELIVIDLTSFSIANALNNTDPGFDPEDGNFGLTPVPSYFASADQISLILIPGGTDGFDLSGQGFTWDLNTNAISPNVGYTMASDIFRPTGESLSALQDHRFPTNPDLFPMYHANTLHIYDPVIGERWPIFHNPALSMFAPTFAMNGKQVAFVGDNGTESRVYRLNRDGTLLGSVSNSLSTYDIAGAPDGFIYIKRDGTTPGLYSINLRAGDTDGSLVWSGVNNTFPRISWVGSLGSNTFMTLEPPYTAWAELAEHTADGAVSGGPALAVGMTASVFTTEGDTLRVRAGAGISYLVIRQIPMGTIVTIIGGPVSADGFVWWNIQLADGTTGWVVDFADGEQTLIPTGGGDPAATPVTVAPTATLGADPSLASQLRIGDNALVTTNSLRLRTMAGVGGAVIREMPRNTYVHVIGGPTRLDNLDWWNIRLLDGTTGWAAEIVGSERVLTYTTNPPPATATPDVPFGPSPTPFLLTTPLILVPLPSPTPLIFILPTPDVPVQVSPADGHVYNVFPRTTTLRWNPAPGAATYILQRQWCNTSGTDCTNYDNVETAATEYTFNFIGAQVGRWRVRSVSGLGINSDWSPWRTFRHQQ